MHVLISPNPYRDKKFEYARRARAILAECGVSASFCLPFGTENDVDQTYGIDFLRMEDVLPKADVYICLGGDGTILHASKVAADYDIPILGVNVGTLGFMSELDVNHLELLRRLPEQNYTLEERIRLQIDVFSGGKVVYSEHALNDAVVTKGAIARVLQLSVGIAGKAVTSFTGDGVIISTPTGSTAYSLSAGGPVVEPTAQVMLITPICAHAFGANCIVTTADRAIDVYISKSKRRSAFLSADGGRAFRLESGDTVRVSKSEKRTQFIRMRNVDFFETLQQKFSNR